MKTVAIKTHDLIQLMYEIHYNNNNENKEQYFQLRDELYHDIYNTKWGTNQAIAENYSFTRWLITKATDNLL